MLQHVRIVEEIAYEPEAVTDGADVDVAEGGEVVDGGGGRGLRADDARARGRGVRRQLVERNAGILFPRMAPMRLHKGCRNLKKMKAVILTMSHF